MGISKEFTDAVQGSKLVRVRIMLKDSLLLDTTLKQFIEMEKYASDNLDNLYDAHNNEKLDYDESNWNTNYLNQQMINVVGNFSKERVGLLKQMVQNLYPERIEQINNQNSKAKVNEVQTNKVQINEVQTNKEQSNNGMSTQTMIAAGTIVVGGACVIIGLATSESTLVAAGLGIAVVGGVLLYTSKGGK